MDLAVLVRGLGSKAVFRIVATVALVWSGGSLWRGGLLEMAWTCSVGRVLLLFLCGVSTSPRPAVQLLNQVRILQKTHQLLNNCKVFSLRRRSFAVSAGGPSWISSMRYSFRNKSAAGSDQYSEKAESWEAAVESREGSSEGARAARSDGCG